jgi:hypothetical protein
MAEGQPIEFAQRELSANDFDGTIAITSEPAPNGMTVALAYEAAVQRVLGTNALSEYQAGGGLRNRAPSEVIIELAPTLETEAVRRKTEDLVSAKLSVLSDQVGQRLPDGAFWPRPTEGFTDFWTKITAHPQMDTAIVSSGHQAFIERFYEVQDLPGPDLMVTDDDMRPLMEYLAPELCVKPGRLLLDIVHGRWLALHDIEPTYENLKTSRERIIYAGDDPNKDGGLADNAGVRFMHIDPDDSLIRWFALGEVLPFVGAEVSHA